MKILLGTPIHVSKDYAVQRWLDCVAALSHPIDELFLVDNSPTPDYSEQLKERVPFATVLYCNLVERQLDFRIAHAREIIRRKVLDNGYDWWFSWECDTLAPPECLDVLLRFGQEFDIVHHSYPTRQDPDIKENAFGLSILHHRVLEQHVFIGQAGEIDPLMPNCFHGGESWFSRRVLRAGGKYIELFGVIQPVIHLDS